MLANFAKANYFEKARQQPERVRQVLDKVRTDGLVATYEAVSAKLDQPMPLGYCNVGSVLAVGEGADGFKVGDRVVSNCAHVEVALAPKNLCTVIPDGIDDEAAAFTVISAIALQGIDQRLGDRLLADQVGKLPRPVTPGEDRVSFRGYAWLCHGLGRLPPEVAPVVNAWIVELATIDGFTGVANVRDTTFQS